MHKFAIKRFSSILCQMHALRDRHVYLYMRVVRLRVFEIIGSQEQLNQSSFNRFNWFGFELYKKVFLLFLRIFYKWRYYNAKSQFLLRDVLVNIDNYSIVIFDVIQCSQTRSFLIRAMLREIIGNIISVFVTTSLKHIRAHARQWCPPNTKKKARTNFD